MQETLFQLPVKKEGGLRFRTKTEKARSEKIKAAKKALIWPPNYHVCKTTADLGRIASKISRHGYFSFDTETSGTNPFKDKCYCISVFVDGQGYLINFDHPLLPQIDSKEFKSIFLSYFQDDEIEKICFNINFDCHILESNFGIIPGYLHHDPSTASWLLVQNLPEGQRKLKRLCESFLGLSSLETYDEKFGKTAFIMVDPQLGAHYAIQDAELHYKLNQYMLRELKKIPCLYKLYSELDMPIQNRDYKIEAEGFDVDEDYVRGELSQNLQETLDNLINEMTEIGLPQEIDLDSPQVLAGYLFDQLKLPRIMGNSTSVTVLEELKERHPLVPLIMDYRSTYKLKTGFADSLSILIEEGKIHPSVRATGTSTGRSTYYNPNLQNQPVRIGSMIRRAFIAKEDYIIVSKDYAGQELRIMSHFAGPGPLRDVILQDREMYAETASVFYKVPAETLVKGDIRRDLGKKAFLAKQYLCQGKKIAAIFGVSKAEGDRFVKDFDARFWDITNYTQNVLAFAHKHGYSEGILGRRRHFDFKSAVFLPQVWALEREANNNPIQNTASEQLKIAFLLCSIFLEKNYPRSKCRLRIHDEILFWIHKEDWGDKLSGELDYIMLTAIEMDLPFKIKTEVYPSGPDGISRWGVTEYES